VVKPGPRSNTAATLNLADESTSVKREIVRWREIAGPEGLLILHGLARNRKINVVVFTVFTGSGDVAIRFIFPML
jgi:hypothetical protein